MFVSNSMFDDDDVPASTSSQPTPQVSVETETPAQKREKMMAMKRAALAKRKAKLGKRGMMRKADTKTRSNTNADATLPDEPDTLVIHTGDGEQAPLKESAKHLMNQGLTAVFDPTQNGGPRTVKPRKQEVKLDFSDMRTFLTNAPPKDAKPVQCYIVRNKTGLRNKMYPIYELYMEGSNRFFLAAKKRSKNKTSNYLISMDKTNLEKESTSYLGKTRANFVGTEFTIFDKGINPNDVVAEAASISNMTVRQELAYVQYESNFLGSRGPRVMTVVIPKMKNGGQQRVAHRPMDSKQGIADKFKIGDMDNFIKLGNKPPDWNRQVGAYVLNFKGRVSAASVKNFQLVASDDDTKVLLQFGKTGKSRFTMDFQYPLSPLQAFGICLSSFDYKLACE